jgi:hypothetical protein
VESLAFARRLSRLEVAVSFLDPVGEGLEIFFIRDALTLA